jgi:hypothetical protein
MSPFIEEGGRDRERVTVVTHVGVERPTACRSGGNATRARLERLPCPHATDEWGRDQFQTVPGRGFPLGRAIHKVRLTIAFLCCSKIHQILQSDRMEDKEQLSMWKHDEIQNKI